MTNSPLRVTFVIQKLLGLAGGAERVFLNTAKAMSERGFDIEILIYDHGSGAPFYDATGLNIRNLFPFPSKTKSGHTPGFLKQLPSFGPLGHLKWEMTHGLHESRLRAALEKQRPDVVVAFLPPAITASVRATRELKIPVVASLHNVPQMDYESPMRWDQNPVFRRRALSALQDSDAITVLLEEFRDWFPNEQKPKVNIVPNAVSRLSPIPEIKEKREKVVLGVGRLTDVKRYNILVEAWSLVHASHPDWVLHIYGDGPNRAELEHQVDRLGLQDVIALKGVCQNLGPVYDKASILCHPASFEGYGLVVAEAMAHGLPVVGFSGCQGINSLITNEENGLLVPETFGKEAKRIANGICRLIEDEVLAGKIATNSLAIMDTYSVGRVVDQWEAIVRKIA